MARTQALLIQIATGDPRPISKQIVDGVRMKIATGELAVGAQLPSVRGLAQQLTINPNTVAKAYAELTGDGWLEARQGLGLYVATPRQRLSKAANSSDESCRPRSSSRTSCAGFNGTGGVPPLSGNSVSLNGQAIRLA